MADRTAASAVLTVRIGSGPAGSARSRSRTREWAPSVADRRRVSTCLAGRGNRAQDVGRLSYLRNADHQDVVARRKTPWGSVAATRRLISGSLHPRMRDPWILGWLGFPRCASGCRGEPTECADGMRRGKKRWGAMIEDRHRAAIFLPRRSLPVAAKGRCVYRVFNAIE
jgi:hypothetical protein